MAEALQILVNVLSVGSLFALAALGVGLLFGVLRLINFAHGDFIMIGAYSLVVPSANAVAILYIGSWVWPLMVTGVLSVVVLVAMLSERIVFLPLRRADATSLLAASFALSFVMQYAVLLVHGGRPKAVDVGSMLYDQIDVFGISVPMIDFITIGASLVVLALLGLFLRYTRYGIEMRAAAEDFRMARLLGVRANTVILFAFAISGILAGVVSILYVSRTGILAPRMGVPLVMVAFVATVIGGMGSLVGAAVGGFFVGATSVLLQVFLPVELRAQRDAFLFLLVIAVLLWRPQGLIQVRSMKERV